MVIPCYTRKTYKELEAENKDLRAKIARLEMELQKEDNDVKPKHCSFCSEKIYDGLLLNIQAIAIVTRDVCKRPHAPHKKKQEHFTRYSSNTVYFKILIRTIIAYCYSTKS